MGKKPPAQSVLGWGEPQTLQRLQGTKVLALRHQMNNGLLCWDLFTSQCRQVLEQNVEMSSSSLTASYRRH